MAEKDHLYSHIFIFLLYFHQITYCIYNIFYLLFLQNLVHCFREFGYRSLNW